MPDPQSISVNEEERMIPVWSIIAASLAFVLVEYYFWIIAPSQHHHRAAGAGSAHLLQSLVGRGGLALLPDGGLHQQRCAAARDEHAVLDVHLLRDAGRHRRRALLPAAAAAGFALPGVRHARAERFSFLPAVQLPACGQLRQLLPHGARYRSVLHALRPRAGHRIRRRRGCA